MRFESRTWFLLSLLLLLAAVFFWQYGNDYAERKRNSRTNAPAVLKTNSALPRVSYPPLLTRLSSADLAAEAQRRASMVSGPEDKVATATFPPRPGSYRLANTAKTFARLSHSDSALLLRNAWIDTDTAVNLRIPPHLRGDGDSSNYLIQSRGPINSLFRKRLTLAGAEIISYIPNNAFLVRIPAASARRLAGAPEIRAVLPYEPYYKLEERLLALAVEEKPLPDNHWLRLTLFPKERDSGVRAIAELNGELIAEEPTPFGAQLLVRPAPDSLAALAGLDSVQTIEPHYERTLANDLSRIQLGISTNGSTAVNHLGLSGSNVIVNVTDSGLDADHPDLRGRVTAADTNLFRDVQGHGTHVAGTIAGDGSQSVTVAGTPGGSDTNANFRGMAPAARIFALPIRWAPEVQAPLSDTFLQESAARTNTFVLRRRNAPLISNNSWFYTGSHEYDSAAARWDAAVRDALPTVTNAQPMIYVFPSGNSGAGNDSGLGGDPNSIPSPGSAKNVITVGALEHPRFLTNAIVSTNGGLVTTNAPFAEGTDNDDQVAAFSGRGNTGIGTEGDFGRFKPDVVAPGAFILSARSRDWQPAADTNDSAAILDALNASLAPSYRYESGSSMAAAAVSGVLALIQEFFETRLPANLRRTNSPALMKAALINGARSAGPLYDLQVKSSVNHQGWGLVNLTNTLPELLLSQPEGAWPIRFIDQSPTNAIATGQSRSWDLNLAIEAQQVPLRLTLVWTDPPGNPNAGIKLVNDLDLVVSNTVTRQVYYGNSIPAASDFTPASEPATPPTFDVINNVENVFIREPFASNLVVSVIGRRVNVNAVPDYRDVTGEANDVVQDFALVVSTDDLTLTNAFTLTPGAAPLPPEPPPATTLTNGMPVLNQRVGAQPPGLELRHGLSPQWNFYVFTNTFQTNTVNSGALTNGTNVAFVTFTPPNLSRARNNEADIDLYVSTDRGLLTLQPTAVDNALKSAGRGGTESIVLTNAALDQIFYIGVKSEDQQASEYGLITFSSNEPFDMDDNGNRVLRGFPVPADIPDGSASDPGGVRIFAIGTQPNLVQRVIVTNVVSHENLGDLIGILSHDRASVVLNNHTFNPGGFLGTNLFIYDDSTFAPVLNSRRSDGPGSLNDFAGLPGNGVWMLDMVDNSPAHTGRVELLTIRVEPLLGGDLGLAGAAGLSGTVGPGQVVTYFHDVPPEATNLIVRLSQLTGPLQLFVRRESMPTTNQFDKMSSISPPGGELTLGLLDQPEPLLAGRYFIALFNPDLINLVRFHIVSQVELSSAIDSGLVLKQTNAVPILDQAVTRSSFFVTADKHLTDVQVGVRVNHPRPSDLAVHLVSPQGTRILLTENRGGMSAFGYGSGFDTNISFTFFTEKTNDIPALQLLKFATPPFTNLFGGALTSVFFDGFEGSSPGEYATNTVVSGWTVTSGKVQLHGPTNSLGVQALSGTNFLELDTRRSPAAVLRTFNSVPGADYILNLSFHRNPSANPGAAHALQLYYGPQADFRPPTRFLAVNETRWQAADLVFRATSEVTAVEIGSLTSGGPLLDSIQVFDAGISTNTFVIPEESLNLLRGERSLGEWRLEIDDTRRGTSGAVGGSLLSWQLQLKYGAPRIRAVPLQNTIPFTGSLTNSQTNYFIIDVCDTTTIADIKLTGPFDKLNLLVDRSGLPTGRRSTDDYVALRNDRPDIPPVSEMPPTNGVPSTNGIPPTNVISSIIRMSSTNGIPPTNGVPSTNGMPAANGSVQFHLTADPLHAAPLEPGKQFYVAVHNANFGETNNYTVQVTFDLDECHNIRPLIVLTNNIPFTNSIPPEPTVLDNYVFNVSTNAEGVTFDVTPSDGDVGLVLRYGLPLPSLDDFHYFSDNPGIANELIFITTNSTPVPLAPGDWYLSVFNKGTNTVNYTVVAYELVTKGLNIIPLTNAVPVDFTIQVGSALTNFFRFSLTNPAALLKFSLSNATGPAELFYGLNRLPPFPGAVTNSAGPNLNAMVDIANPLLGNYFLAVHNKGSNDLPFTIKAEVFGGISTNELFIDPKLDLSDPTKICLSWPSIVGATYRVEGKTNITDARWTVITTTVAITTNSSYCINRPTQFSFFRIVQEPQAPPPPSGEFINPQLVFKGTNELCLRWASLVGTNYFVEAKTNINDAAWQRISAMITATNTVTEFCVALPTPYQFFQIAVVGGAAPPPPPPTGQFLDPKLEFKGTNNLCFSWQSVVGTNYVVEAKTNVEDTVWQRISPVITATNALTEFCVPFPTPYRFFRIAIVGGAAPPPPPPASIPLNAAFVTGGDGRLRLSWPASVGQQYQLQFATNLVGTLNWFTLTNVTATTNSITITDPTPATNGVRFYRLRLP